MCDCECMGSFHACLVIIHSQLASCSGERFGASEAELKPIVPRSHAFSRAWCRLHAFASNSFAISVCSDWSGLLLWFLFYGISKWVATKLQRQSWDSVRTLRTCRRLLFPLLRPFSEWKKGNRRRLYVGYIKPQHSHLSNKDSD